MVLHWHHLGVTTAPEVGVIFAHMRFLTVSVMEPHSNFCRQLAEIAVWFHHTACFIAFYASDH